MDLDPELRRRWRGMAARLPELQIGRHGQLQEWNEDFDEVEPAHRHVSHLVGLHPGDLLDPERTPELWRGAERPGPLPTAGAVACAARARHRASRR